MWLMLAKWQNVKLVPDFIWCAPDVTSHLDILKVSRLGMYAQTAMA
jgi:hypothetical protein